MRQSRFRQVARLEELAQPYLERRRKIEKDWRQTISGAAAHAAILAFVIRYGNPTIGEPLLCACQRCSKSSTGKEFSDKFPSILSRRPGEYSFKPHNRDSALVIGTPLRHLVISIFPGADEKEKLDAVFASAPPWLIWFTFGDYTAELLGLTPPDLSSETGFARSKANFDLWWGLPSDAFERRPWPDALENEPLARTDLNLLHPTTTTGSPDDQITPRERKRANANYMKSDPLKRMAEWPGLLALELIHSLIPPFLRSPPRD